jgi:serine/threonine-protein kinase
MELAHARGVVHRDLKPANVFLHRPGSGALVPKVLDFGISKIVGGKAPEIALTNTTAILGSPSYMSPEQMTPEAELDARSDIHALGVLLWELLTGRAPFLSTSYNLLVVEIIRGPRPKLRDVMPAASRDLAAIVERAFAIEATERFESAAALASALELELAKLSGGVLAGRGAADTVLGALDLSSNAPPPVHGSTTVPLSFDPASKLSPTLRSEDGLNRRDVAAVSFADTEVAAGGARVAPRGAAVSAERATTAKASSMPFRVGGGLVLAAAAAGVLVVAMRRAPKAPEPLGPEPATSPAAVVSAPTAAPSVAIALPAPVIATAAPPIAASASAPVPPPAPVPRAPAPASTPKKTPRATPAASATAAPRPRIDQSGL